jgi:hypothetical protein
VEPGDIVSFYQYGNSSAQNPQRVEVIETKLNVPPKSAYMIPSTEFVEKSKYRARFFQETPTLPNRIFFTGSGTFSAGVYNVDTDDSGFYITGSFIEGTEFIDTFKTRFDNSKNDWYVTIYNTLASPVIYNGDTSTENYEFTSNFNSSDPLGYYGVSKITEVFTDGSLSYYLGVDRPLSSLNNIYVGGGKGILIWESWGNSIIVRGSNLSGVGASLVYSEFAPKALTDNLDYISRTYTNKS